MTIHLRYILACCLTIICVNGHTIDDYKQCLCVGHKDILIQKQPTVGPDVAGTLQSDTCYRHKTIGIEEINVNETKWLAVSTENEIGFVLRDAVEIRNCVSDDQHTITFQDRSSLRNVVPNAIHSRASSLGNTAACGQTLQRWANLVPGRVLAQRGKSCYGLQTSLRQTYQYAFTYCQSSVSYLVDILDGQEQAFVETLVNLHMAGEKTWIGLHDVQTERVFDWTSGTVMVGEKTWIGLHDVQTERVFDWTSGKPTSYVNWYSASQAYTSSTHDTEDCVALNPYHGGKWEVEKCYTGHDSTEPKHVFICEFEIKGSNQMVG